MTLRDLEQFDMNRRLSTYQVVSLENTDSVQRLTIYTNIWNVS